ncbi:MAG: N-acetyltransferase [Saprospiraceae bacterium]|nr:N-acetyltransferase [Saprospiraceae bacterium]MBK7811017.1 N-acetyltransferase [Saprospiraceae bacterium]MBK9630620.1 N-acetyltransferase [Saprospiraceae bacterium]
MEILQNDHRENGKFYIEEEGEIVGEMTYIWSDQNMIIEHTEVGPSLAGKGAGKKFVQKAVDLARENNFKIIPVCPFAKSVFDKTEAIQDVLFKI